MTREEKIISEQKSILKIILIVMMLFLCGVEFAEDNQWISVEDDLPYNHRELIHDNYTTNCVLVLDNGYPYVRYMSKLSDDKWYWTHSANVTHWMPIPKFENNDDKH